MFRRLAWIGCGLGVVTITAAFYSLNAISQEPLRGQQSPDLIVIEPAPVTADVYLDLVRQKVELITAEELARETDQLRKELAEFQANRKLREAEQQLEQLIDQFRDSNAAKRARAMLEAGRRLSKDYNPEADGFKKPMKRTEPNRS